MDTSENGELECACLTVAAGDRTRSPSSFSYGPMIWLGKNLALMEVRVLLCWVVWLSRVSKLSGVIYGE